MKKFLRKICWSLLSRRATALSGSETWTVQDGLAARQFWDSPTGRKLSNIMGGAVYDQAMLGREKDFLEGSISMMEFVLSLQSPLPRMTPEEKKGEELVTAPETRATMQEQR